MTRTELAEALAAIDDGHLAEERCHLRADRLLLEYIDDPAVTAAFEKVPRWYS